MPGEVEGVPIAELAGRLDARSGRPGARLGAPVAGPASDAALDARLRQGLDVVRRRKDPVELQRMRIAEGATRAGFAAIAPMLEAGRTEREVQIELEAAFFRAGADALAFDSIVAGGPNAAVLHFPPTARPFGDGELVLVDAGGEYRGYASDVTRTYPVGGTLAPEQAELHELVHAAGLAAIERCVAGTEFREVHWTAARVIAEGLLAMG